MSEKQSQPLTRIEAPPAESLDAMTRIPRDLAVLKIENETLMAMATAHPRSHAEILADVKSQLETYKAFAEEAMYAKPVGRMEKCPECGAETNYQKRCPGCNKEVPQKIARGLSIRAAEALAHACGANKWRTAVVQLDPDTVRVEAVFIDYQRGRIVEDSAVVSKNFTDRYGRTKRINDDRFHNVIVPARKSIVLRECILRMIPPGLRAELETCVDQQLDQFLDETTVKKIVAQFSQKDVSPAMLENLLGKSLDRLTKEDRKTLLGVWNSIKSGETTVAEAFGEPTTAPEPTGGPLGVDGAAKRLAGKAPTADPQTEPSPDGDAHLPDELFESKLPPRRGHAR